MKDSSPWRQSREKPGDRCVQSCEMKALGNRMVEEGSYEVACCDGLGGGAGWVSRAFDDEGFGLFGEDCCVC
jgi:hypothetical protein